jgi:hypothetical protein
MRLTYGLKYENYNHMKKFYTLLFSLLFSVALFGQRVTGINAFPSGNNIIVKYKIEGARFYQEFKAELYVSIDGGNTFKGPLQKVTGNVGENVTKGENEMMWDVLNEMPYTDAEFIFDVRIETNEEKVKKHFFVQYVGNAITPIGARIGILGKTNFFIEARMSGNFGNANYEYTGDVIDNYDAGGYYEFKNSDGYDAMSIVGGLNFQMGRGSFYYLGAGYGSQKYIVEIDQYSYANNAKISSDWAASSTATHEGAEVTTGFIFKPGIFVISVGATSLNFEVFNFTAGLGFAF